MVRALVAAREVELPTESFSRCSLIDTVNLPQE